MQVSDRNFGFGITGCEQFSGGIVACPLRNDSRKHAEMDRRKHLDDIYSKHFTPPSVLNQLTRQQAKEKR